MVCSPRSHHPGYRAVILGPHELPKLFPMLMTAARHHRAGARADPRARRGGLQPSPPRAASDAVVEAFDVRKVVQGAGRVAGASSSRSLPEKDGVVDKIWADALSTAPANPAAFTGPA